MEDTKVLEYVIQDPLELNLSYMPFIKNGGLFIPTHLAFALGDIVQINLQLPGKKESIAIEGKIVWITPPNALHHVLPGVGVQFAGQDSESVRKQVESHLDTSMVVGGYTYGIMGETTKQD